MAWTISGIGDRQDDLHENEVPAVIDQFLKLKKLKEAIREGTGNVSEIKFADLHAFTEEFNRRLLAATGKTMEDLDSEGTMVLAEVTKVLEDTIPVSEKK